MVRTLSCWKGFYDANMHNSDAVLHFVYLNIVRRTLKIFPYLAFFILICSSVVHSTSLMHLPGSDIRGIVYAAELYLEQKGTLPTNIDQLVRYRYLDRIPKDPWGREYRFSAERPDITDADMPFYVWCLGRDGSVGGNGLDSDVGNWDPFEPPGPWWKLW